MLYNTFPFKHIFQMVSAPKFFKTEFGSTTNYFRIIAPNKCEHFRHNAATGYEPYEFEYELLEYCDIDSIIQEAHDGKTYRSLTQSEWLGVVKRFNRHHNQLLSNQIASLDKQLAA